MIYGRDDWLAPMDIATSASIPSIGQIEERRDLEIMFAPYAPLIPAELNFPIINRMGKQNGMRDGGLEPMIATGLRWVIAHGHSKLRKLASSARLR